MTTRRRVIGGLAAVTLALSLAACSSDDGDEGSDESPPPDGDTSEYADQMVGAMEDFGVGDTFTATEPVELSLLYRDHPNYPYNEDWLLFQSIAERNNVTFDVTMAPLSDWAQRRSLLVGAGDAPFLIPVTYHPDEEPFVASGAILPVSDYLDLMPNFQDKIDRWDLEPYLATLRQEDGKFYLLPGILEAIRPDYTLAMRTDVLDELGIDEPQTWDEVREALVAIKEAYPDSIPLSDRFQGNSMLAYAAPAFGTSAGWGYGGGVTYDDAAGEFVYTAATDEYRSMLEYFNGLVADGLLDPESFTQEDDVAIQKLVNEQSFALSTNEQEVVNNRNSLEETLGEGNATIAKIRVPAGPAGDIIDGNRLESGVMISADAAESENFVAMIQFVDWLYYSDEGLEFAKWGVEGETFDRASDGTRTLDPEFKYAALNPDAPKDLRVDNGFSNGVVMLAQGSTTDLVQSMLSEEEVAWQETMANKEVRPVAPPYPLNELEREQVSLYQTALKDHVDQNTLAFILGQRDLSEWDDFVSELEGMNMNEYVDVVNGAAQRYADANG